MYMQVLLPVLFSCCYNLAKWLSYYLYFFWTSYTERSVEKCHIIELHSHSHRVMSHDKYGKVVHRLCSNCISSVENLMGTLLSSPC